MRVAVVHNAVGPNDAVDVRDVLVQVETVSTALHALGHSTHVFSCSSDLDATLLCLRKLKTDVVFNLVESLNGRGEVIHLFPYALEAAGIPCTGSKADTLLYTGNKVMAKSCMVKAGIPTPPWWGPFPFKHVCSAGFPQSRLGPAGTWIIKSVWEHGSMGLDETSLVEVNHELDLESLIKARLPRLDASAFAERYVEGREFNLSLLAGPQRCRVFPPAEIVFEGFGNGTPRIVDYRAKWDESSYAFRHTPRKFNFPEQDRSLLKSLSSIAAQCWDLFGLSGYARVDFRVDVNGNPWVLEVNANPCLSSDAGFAAALEIGGMTMVEAVEMVLADAFRR